MWTLAPWLPACPDPGASETAETSATAEPGPTTGADETLPTEPDPTAGPCRADDCAPGEYCDELVGACAPGCDDEGDCPGSVCVEHQCADCVGDSDCGVGAVCAAGRCVAGCSDEQPCEDGLACCDGHCAELDFDPLHCGSCDPCPPLAHAESTCTGGVCSLAACTEGFADCDAESGNGCESADACACTPGEQVDCYSGPAGTAGQGPCVAGTSTCAADGLGFTACTGEVLPAALESCNAIDDDCNGTIDDLDADGDGFSQCGEDCCDTPRSGCPEPALVNPGAFEILGNALDDDCDPTTLDLQAPAACDAGLTSDSADALDYARAIDLCTFTTEADKHWGVLSAAITRADGVQAAYAGGSAIRDNLGPNVVPKKNLRLAMLSTGNAAAPGDVAPEFSEFQDGLDTASVSDAPADWLAANGGAFPVASGCPAAASAVAHDSVMLTLRVRVPSNARSFTLSLDYFSAEWPEWACTPVNDRFVALLDSQAADVPADKNVAVYVGPDAVPHPIDVNLALASSDMFPVCFPGTAGCMGDAPFETICPGGTLELVGTGFFQPGDTGCGDNKTTGGATGWLKLAANVEPGEIIELRLAIWDTGNGLFDSLVVLDNWRWSTTPATVGVTPN